MWRLYPTRITTRSHGATALATISFFFLIQAMDSVATNGSTHLDTCVSGFYCDKDINGEVIFDTVADVPFEWNFTLFLYFPPL